MNIKGEYRDVLIKKGTVIEDRGWRSNSITQDYGRFLAALMKKEVTDMGIEYMAVGGKIADCGSKEVDKLVKFKDNAANYFKDNIVKHENENYWIWAKEIESKNIIYLDKDDKPTNIITNKLQIDITIEKSEPTNETLIFEQFALLGIKKSNGSFDTDKMFLINYVDHGPITKDTSMELERTIKLTFPIKKEVVS